ncbi:hypothetical protein Tco_0640501 [Tanacetum coccineum]
MSNPKFAETHNLVAFLKKPEESDGFEEIIDFLNASYVQYALTADSQNRRREAATMMPERLGRECVVTLHETHSNVDKLHSFLPSVVANGSKLSYEAHVSTPSYDPPQSGEDSLQLSKLINLCTSLQEKVLDLEKNKTAQAKEICYFKRKIVKQSKRGREVKNSGLKKVKKCGSTSRVESSINASLGTQEDASKQGRKIKDLDADADAEVTLVNENQEMNDDNLMFDTGVLEEQEIEFEKVVAEPVVSVATTTKSILVSTAEVVTTASAIVQIPDELTLSQTLIEIKTAKPKPITTTATIVTSVRPRDKGIIFHDQEEQIKLQAKLIEAQLQAKLIEEEMLARKKEEEANIALIKSWDNIQAMISSESGSDDEEYVMAVRNIKKFFRRKGKFVRQPREEKKSFRQRDERKGKSDQKCFRYGDPNHLIVNCPKPSRNKDQKAFIGVSALKLPILKTRDYDLWSMRMKQYLTHTDYSLWKVIMNGDAPAIASASTEVPIPPKTAEQKLARKNELKAKSTLLLAIPNEHLLKFHGINDAKTLWKAIKAMFGGNKESKKMQKPILKQQYENFTASRSEGLDKTYDRFQKLIIQLEIHGDVISYEDANLKLLRSLPSAWNNSALIMRNKADLDELSMDDLYNNLKAYEAEIKSQSSSSSNSQNMDFVSSDDTRSANEGVNTAHDVPVARSKAQASSSTYADDVIDGSQIAGGHAYHEGEEILKEDRKQSEFQWAPRNQGNRNGDAPRRIVPVETPKNALVVQDGIGGYDWSFQAEEGPTDFALMAHFSSGSSSSSSSNSKRDALKKSNLEIIGYQLGLESLEARIVVHQKNEAVYEEDIAFLKYDVKVRDNSIIEHKNQLAKALKEKDDLKLKLEKFETSSMKLTKLINSQISVNNKSGVGFDSQMNGNELHDCYLNKGEVFKSAFDSSVNEIEEENNQVNDRFKKVEGYHAVTHPYTGNYMPSRPNLSFAGLDDYGYKTNMSEIISSVPRIELTASKSSKDSLEQPKDVRPSAPIIEEITGQREVRPAWNNAQRVNHQNKLTHPHPKRNFVPTVVLTKSGNVPVNTAKQSSPRAAISNSTARYVNTVASRPTVNEKVNTAKVNNVTTAGTKAVVSAIQRHEANSVKSSACWI